MSPAEHQKALDAALWRLMYAIGQVEHLDGRADALIAAFQEMRRHSLPLAAAGEIPWEHMSFFDALGGFVEVLLDAARSGVSDG